MIGIIVSSGDVILVAVAETKVEAEGMAMQMFVDAGMNPKEMNVSVGFFKPDETNGLLFQTNKGSWSTDGWTP